MFDIVIASHGQLSLGLVNMLELIVGKNGYPIKTFTLSPGEDSDRFMKELATIAAENVDRKYVVITDVFGGSVNNSALINLRKDNVYIVTGIIPAFVLELYLSTEIPTKEILEKMLEKSKESIKVISNIEINIEKEEF